MSLILLPNSTDAFSQYKPSQNAHTDFLGSSSLGKRKDGEKGGPKVVRLHVRMFRPSIYTPRVREAISIGLSN